jgi:hypothetical protein
MLCSVIIPTLTKASSPPAREPWGSPLGAQPMLVNGLTGLLCGQPASH